MLGGGTSLPPAQTYWAAFVPFVRFLPGGTNLDRHDGLGVALKSPEKLKFLGTVFEVPRCMTASTA
jgi:hypothetical protein